VQLALDSMPRGERVARTTCAIELAYAQLPAVQQLLPRFEATIARQVFGAAVHLEVAVPTEALATLRTALLDATRGEIRLMIAEASTS
jgi:putative IMPACT (imprinted ancient) family translation regulator